MRKYLLAALMAVAMVAAIAPAASVAKKHTTSCPPGTSNSAYCVCPPGTDNAAYCVCPPGTTDTGDTSEGGGGTRDADDPPGCVCKSGPTSDGKCVCPPGTTDARCVCPAGTTDTGDTSEGGGGTRDADDQPGCVCVSGKHACVCAPGTNDTAYCVKNKSNEHGRRGH